MKKLSLYGKVNKGGEADTVKRYLDGFLFGEVWGIINRLAGSEPDLSKLLEVQAEARVVLNLLAELDTDKLLATEAGEKLAKVLKERALPR